MSDGNIRVLRARAAQVIPTDDGVILQRGSTTCTIKGTRCLEVIQVIYERVGTQSATRAHILEGFPPLVRSSVDELVGLLVQQRMLEPAGAQSGPAEESSEATFFWDYGTHRAAVENALASHRFIVLGSEALAAAVAEQLRSIGVTDLIQVSPEAGRFEALLKDPDALGGACVVGCAEHGERHLLSQWNRALRPLDVHFLPLALHNNIGTLGPHVVGRDGPCYDCFRSRENQHLQDPASVRTVEFHAPDNRELQSSHPLMLGMLAHLGAMHVLKVYGKLGQASPHTWLRFDLVGQTLTPHRVLRVPGCPTCDQAGAAARPGLERWQFLPGLDAAEGQ
jgi:bacteriocin biosynthesis cyclodehydratase domain-containing protein